jgi:hypothetical protein
MLHPKALDADEWLMSDYPAQNCGISIPRDDTDRSPAPPQLTGTVRAKSRRSRSVFRVVKAPAERVTDFLRRIQNIWSLTLNFDTISALARTDAEPCWALFVRAPE